MSLDVYLRIEGMKRADGGSGIFVREGGSTKEITREEWDAKFPGREPIVFQRDTEDSTVFSANVTHNLGEMADAAGIGDTLWSPNEIGITKAHQLIVPLSIGLTKLKNDPEAFKRFNPANGWGSYDDFVPWIEEYIAACVKWPDATVRVSR